MIKTILSSLALLLIFMACSQQKGDLDSRFVPREGTILVFKHELDYTRFDHSLLPEMYGMTVYANLYSKVAFDMEDGGKITDLHVFLKEFADLPLVIMLRLTNSHMRKIASGQADADLDLLAEQMKAHNKQIYLGVGYEVNNLRYGIKPAIYTQAHRYLVKRFRQKNVENVSYLWHVIGMEPVVEKPVPLKECYPGDDYVDWVGLSMHLITRAHFDSSGFYEKAAYDQITEFAREHDLPIFMCETSTTSILQNFGYSGQDLWDSWYQPFFDFVHANDVRAVAHNFYFFNDTLILERWKQSTASPEFVYRHNVPGKERANGR